MRVHQALLNILIGKSGALRAVPVVGPPIATALQGLEGIVDQLALGVIRLIPGQASCAQSQRTGLLGTLASALTGFGVRISV